MNKALFEYIAACPTPYHAAEHTANALDDAGFIYFDESDDVTFRRGCGYYTVRGGSSVVAFRIPQNIGGGFNIAAAHCDSPCFKVNENPEIRGGGYIRISTEQYGGMIPSTWLDRPLSLAGRVFVRDGDGMSVRLVDLREPVAMIPNTAIHLRAPGEYAVADLVPLLCSADSERTVRGMVAEELGIKEDDMLSADLYLYNPQPGCAWSDYISAPRLDDLQCAFGALRAFLEAGESKFIPVYCLFDGEEIGSSISQGAQSTLLPDILVRIIRSLGGEETDYQRALAKSFIISCDNAHAAHPNHPELSDSEHPVRMNGGIVIKHNANRRYATDAMSSSLMTLICEEADVPLQHYVNRAGIRGGSTLGCIVDTKVSVPTVDIGLAQLAMHSSYETAGAADTEYLARALKVFYER